MEYFSNDVLVMEVLPFYVLTPIFLQIWLQQVRHGRKIGHSPSFSNTSLIFCYSVIAMDVSVLSLGSYGFLLGDPAVVVTMELLGEIGGSQDYGIKKPTGCESGDLYTYTNLVINLPIIN